MPERATGYAPSFYSPPPLAGEDGWGAACAAAEAAGGARQPSVTPRDPLPTSPAQRERGFHAPAAALRTRNMTQHDIP